MRFLGALLCLLVSLGLAGCFVYKPVDITDTSTPVLDLDAIEVIGTAEGKSCSHFFFGFPISAEAPIHNAYTKAKADSGADGIINVTVDQVARRFLLLYRDVCVSVRGDAIRFVRR